jgi:hypothetical protein
MRKWILALALVMYMLGLLMARLDSGLTAYVLAVGIGLMAATASILIETSAERSTDG